MPSSAADAVERPYNPPVGSHWIIDTETSTDDQRPGGPRPPMIKTHAEMTVDEKTADGFRISYVSRGATFEGNAPMLPIMRQSFKALENVTIHATTDLSGKPVRVDNLDEAKTAMRNMVDSMMAPFQDKPQVADVMNQMMSKMIEVDATQAASALSRGIADAGARAKHRHEAGRGQAFDRQRRNPLGGGMLKSNSAFTLTEADAATGKRVYRPHHRL